MGLIGLRDIDKGGSDAPGIELVIYIIKILYFNHSTSFLSNNFARRGRTNYDHPLRTPASGAPLAEIQGRKNLAVRDESHPGMTKSIARADDVAKAARAFYTCPI